MVRLRSEALLAPRARAACSGSSSATTTTTKTPGALGEAAAFPLLLPAQSLLGAALVALDAGLGTGVLDRHAIEGASLGWLLDGWRAVRKKDTFCLLLYGVRHTDIRHQSFDTQGPSWWATRRPPSSCGRGTLYWYVDPIHIARYAMPPCLSD